MLPQGAKQATLLAKGIQQRGAGATKGQEGRALSVLFNVIFSSPQNSRCSNSCGKISGGDIFL